MSNIKIGDKIYLIESVGSCPAGSILEVRRMDDQYMIASTDMPDAYLTCLAFSTENITWKREQALDTGIKHDDDKVDMSLLSSTAITKIAEVLTFGKKKYSAHNWRNGLSHSRLMAASLRHLFAHLSGETIDPESGLSHLAHAACCVMMLIELSVTRPDLNDLYKPTK